jgi:transcriptional regulator with XRE-family HTH domain
MSTLILSMNRKKSLNQARSRVAANLRKLRLEKDYSQLYVSEILGKTDYTAYQRLESGKTELKLEDAVKLSELYNIPIERIWDSTVSDERAEVGENPRAYQILGSGKKVQIQVSLDGSEAMLQDQIELLTSINKVVKKHS